MHDTLSTPPAASLLAHGDTFPRRHLGSNAEEVSQMLARLELRLLEALINFQQMIIDLTALDIANASLLDEATAAAEGMHIAHAVHKDAAVKAIFVSERCHPQTIAVVQTRAEPLGIKVIVGDHASFDF